MVSGNTLLNSPPSFQQASRSDGYAQSGGISNSFSSGSFNAGESSIMPIAVTVGLLIFAIRYLEKNGRKK